MNTQEVKELETVLRIVIADMLPVDKLNTIAAQQEELLDTVHKHSDTLYGNGKEGVTTTLSRIDRWVTKVQCLCDDVFKWAIIGAMGGGVTVVIYLANHGWKPQ